MSISTLPLVEVLAGFGGGYVYASVLESYFHQHVNDAPKRSVERWRRHPWLLKQLIETNYSHHIIHHVRTYRTDHVTQFDSPEHKATIDRELSRTSHGRAVMKAQYGAAFSPMGWVAFTAPLWPAATLAYVLLGPWVALGVAVAVALPPFLSAYVHPYLHLPYDAAIARSPWPLSLLLRTRYMRAVTRHHFLHHRYCNRNFNLLLGGDWLRGKVRTASPRDVAEMVRLGIRLD